MTGGQGRGSRQKASVQRTNQRASQATDAALSPLGREFVAYWQGKRGSPAAQGGFPLRADIAPDEILGLLPYIFLVDVLKDDEGERDYRFRLVGTAIMNFEGEHTGQLLSGMFPDRETYAVLWRQYAAAAAGTIWVRYETLIWPSREPVTYEVVLAPLQDDEGRITMLIGLAHPLES